MAGSKRVAGVEFAAIMTATFVHLRLHSEYSLVDGIVRIKPLVQACVAADMPAVAVTEQGNLFSMVKFYRAATAAGVKPIIGADIAVDFGRDSNQAARLVLLCQNETGYRNLTRLVTRTYTQGQSRGTPLLDPRWLHGASDGLIALSGGLAGDVGQALVGGHPKVAGARLEAWLELFPDRFYLELQRTGRADEEWYLDGALDLAMRYAVPVVASNDVRFLAPEDFEAHEARVCIHDGRTLGDSRRPRRYSNQQYLRSPQEMIELFADIPAAIQNSVEIARRCNLSLELGGGHLPSFPVPDGYEVGEWLVKESVEGLEGRLSALHRDPDRAGGKGGPDGLGGPDESVDATRARYRERLDMELEVVAGMGFAGYFLIVADFIRWARENGVPVGPGRGSGAGSLVAFALRITDIDPLEHDLLFERFLNPERVSLPDFDIDFCMEGRDRVIEYVAKRYGDETQSGGERVAQIITFGTMAARAVVRDVGRVLGYPYGFVDQVAKLIPFEVGMTLQRALDEEALKIRYREDDEVRTIIDLARKLEGIARNAGRHAGGVVIAPSDLTDYSALYCEPGSTSVVTQFDKDDVEAVGLVKFDFLGLRTLTIIDWAVASINRERHEAGESPIDISRLPTDDPLTYQLICKGLTTAVFQLESRLCKDLIRRLQPDSFDDITALNALIRPGPQQSGMVDDFIDRKQGRSRVVYPHPAVEPILKPTYGVILYQEQVMQIAQVLAGYTLGGADLLRKAMGKKQPEEMAKQRQVFLDGAKARGVEAHVASSVFDIMEKFAGYGFNRAHSAAYALIGYQTAWLKAHYPAAFMAAVLSADMDNTDKMVVFIDECRDLGLDVKPPDVNRCDYAFTAADVKTIRYGLGAVKGVGQGAIAGIIEERRLNGKTETLFDFCRRIDARKVNRRVIEALVRAGALDALGPHRACLMATLTNALQIAEQHSRDTNAGQDDMFGGAVVSDAGTGTFVDSPPWTDDERLTREKEALGVYLTGHPIARFEQELAQIATARLAEVKPTPGRSAIIAGLVVSLRLTNSRKGRMAIVTIDDRTARLDAVVYADVFQTYRDLLVKDRLLVFEGEVSTDDFSGGCSMTVQRVLDIEGARQARAKRLSLRLDSTVVGASLLRALADVIEPYREGMTPVCIDYVRPDARVRMPLGEHWKVRPTEDLLRRLRDIAGGDGVAVEYS